jgi:hypothetical protein
MFDCPLKREMSLSNYDLEPSASLGVSAPSVQEHTELVNLVNVTEQVAHPRTYHLFPSVVSVRNEVLGYSRNAGF